MTPGGKAAHLLIDLFLFPSLPSSIHKLRENVFQEHQTLKEKELETGPKASHGYGGKFGVEQDRMDKVSGPRLPVPGSWCAWTTRLSGRVIPQTFLRSAVLSQSAEAEICPE